MLFALRVFVLAMNSCVTIAAKHLNFVAGIFPWEQTFLVAYVVNLQSLRRNANLALMSTNSKHKLSECEPARILQELVVVHSYSLCPSISYPSLVFLLAFTLSLLWNAEKNSLVVLSSLAHDTISSINQCCPRLSTNAFRGGPVSSLELFIESKRVDIIALSLYVVTKLLQ